MAVPKSFCLQVQKYGSASVMRVSAEQLKETAKIMGHFLEPAVQMKHSGTECDVVICPKHVKI